MTKVLILQLSAQAGAEAAAARRLAGIPCLPAEIQQIGNTLQIGAK
jgi:hypothetical protein